MGFIQTPSTLRGVFLKLSPLTFKRLNSIDVKKENNNSRL